MAADVTVKVDVPEIVNTPLSDSVLPAVASRFPETVDTPRISAFVSTNVTLFPDMIATVLKSLALFKVILFAEPAAKVAIPVTANTPLSVITPAVVTFRVPEIVDAPRSSAFVSFSVTLFPDVITTVEKSSALSNVILFPAPAAKVAVPVTTTAPESVIAPAVVTESVPLTVDAPRSIAFVSVRLTLFPEVITTVEKSLLPLLRVMLLVAPDASVVVPVTVIAPLCVIAPVVVTEAVLVVRICAISAPTLLTKVMAPASLAELAALRALKSMVLIL